MGTQCIYDDELGYWAATKLHTTQAPYYYDDSRREFGISPGQFVLNFCSTATRLRCRRRKSCRYAALPFLVRYTNRPRVHQRRYTKRRGVCRCAGVSVGVSVFTLVTISMERYFAICRPLTSLRWQTRRHACRTIVVAWLVALAAMTPTAVYQRLLRMPTGGHKCAEIWDDRYLEKVATASLVARRTILPRAFYEPL